jgi:hypothetical protein
MARVAVAALTLAPAGWLRRAELERIDRDLGLRPDPRDHLIAELGIDIDVEVADLRVSLRDEGVLDVALVGGAAVLAAGVVGGAVARAGAA